jgi:hypothetical protein
MSNKKHRPIVMNRNKTPGRTAMIFKKALIITAILAFVEVVILVVLHFKKTDKPVVKTQEKPKEIARQPAKDTSKVVVSHLPEPIPVKELVAQKDTTEIIKPLAKKTQPVVQKLKDSAVVKVTKPKESKSVKPVSEERMFEILNEVRMVKMQANNPAKCVSIRIVSSTNAENGSRIANYLRKNGYVISGREVVAGTQKGIQVDASGPCIKLAIGAL